MPRNAHGKAVAGIGVALALGVACGNSSQNGGGSGSASGSGAGGSGVSTSGASASGVAVSGANASGSGTSGAATSGASTSGQPGGSGAGGSGVSASGLASSGAAASGANLGDGATNDCCPAGVLGHCCGGPATLPTHTGYSLYLDEEFAQPIDLDNDPNWTWSDGGLAEGSVRFIESQVTFASSVTDDVPGGQGYLILTADTKPASLTIPPMSYAENTNVASKAQISGELRTKYNNYRYGWYEARYKPPPSTEGNFISTLFVFRTPKIINWREIDIELTPDAPSDLGTNVYVNDNNGNYIENNGDVGSNPILGVTNDSQAFHVYAIEWQPTFVNWYVDGQLTRHKDTNADDGGPNKSVPIPMLSTKILMNLWVFGAPNMFGGADPSANVYPMHAEYDYFRFYKWNTDGTYPCSPTPSCIKPVDCVNSKNNPNDHVPDNEPNSGGTCVEN